MAQITISVLAIGQGSSSLLEVWEGASYATRTNLFVALMDCGSDDNRKSLNVKASIAAIQDAMNRHTNAEGITPPYLDMLIISHQDMDHWDKLDLVFEAVKGKRQINHNGQLIDTCIQKPTEIENLNFSCVNADILVSQEQYSKFNSFDSVIYIGSQHLVIEKQDYFMNIEWFYSGIFKSASYTLEFEIDDPYMEISLFYNNNNYFSNWSIITDTENIYYSYIQNYSTKKYDLSVDFFTVIETYDTWDLQSAFKKTLDDLILKYKVNIKSDTIIKVFTIYDQFMTQLNYQKVVDTIQKNLNLHCCIGQSFIGGQKDIYSPSFKNTRDKIKKLSSTKVASLIKNQKIKDIFMNTSWNLSCKILCCTALSDCKLTGGGSGRSLKHNASSAVALWNINNTKVLYPGDATIHTMYYMRKNDLLKYATNSLVLAPHHGSGTTSAKASSLASKKRKRDDDDPWEELGAFLDGLSPSEIIISAGLDNHHGHPNLSFIEKSEEVLKTKPTAEHNICYNIQLAGKTDRKYKKRIEKCTLYTTVVYNQYDQAEYQARYLHCNTTNLTNRISSNFIEDTHSMEAIHYKQDSNNEMSREVETKQEQSFKKSNLDINQLDFLDYTF